MGNVPFVVILFAVLALPASGGEGAALPAAAIGGGEVSEQDISDWQAAQACYGPEAMVSRQAAFMRLYEATILEEVLGRQAKRPITAADYGAEAARIDRETRAPDILGCIKKYFGGDGPRYRRVFVRPILAQRYMREFVAHSPEAQAGVYSLRGAILKDMGKKKTFKQIGAERGVEYSTSAYSLAPEKGGDPRRWAPYEAAFINSHLKNLKPGEAAAPIEDEYSVRFVRLLGAAGEKYDFETLSLPKLTTEAYLKSVPKLPAAINDRELYDWVAGINGNPLITPASLAPQSGSKSVEKQKQ